MSTADNDLLLSLFVNLRNAAATFGTDSVQYKSVHGTVYDHLRQMKDAGRQTDITGARQSQQQQQQQQQDSTGLADAFKKLDLELRGGEGEGMEL